MASEFDDIPIDVYQGRFNGAFEVEFSDEKYLRMDSEVMIVVRAKCGGASLKSMANGDVRLVRSLKLQEGAVVKNGKLKAYLADQLDLQRDEDPLVVTPAPKDGIPDWEDDGGTYEDDEYTAYNRAELTPGPTQAGADEDGNFGIIVEDDDDVLLADSWEEEDSWESLPSIRSDAPAPGEIRRVGFVAPRDPLVARYLAEPASE